jgi:hypothetical protein
MSLRSSDVLTGPVSLLQLDTSGLGNAWQYMPLNEQYWCLHFIDATNSKSTSSYLERGKTSSITFKASIKRSSSFRGATTCKPIGQPTLVSDDPNKALASTRVKAKMKTHKSYTNALHPDSLGQCPDPPPSQAQDQRIIQLGKQLLANLSDWIN